MLNKILKRFSNENSRGQISVYLVIILSGVLLLCGVLTDICRIVCGEKSINRAGHTAARSALAEYSTALEERYGIFALNLNNQGVINGESLEDTIKEYLESNLSAGGDGFDIYNFRVEQVKVAPLFNLTENHIVRNQILEYMKYRAPKEIAEGLWDKLQAVMDAGKISGAYEKKTQIDKKLGKLDDIHKELKKNLEGVIADGIYEKVFVSGFNRDGEREQAARELAQAVTELKNMIADVERTNQEIMVLMQQIEDEDEREDGKGDDGSKDESEDENEDEDKDDSVKEQLKTQLKQKEKELEDIIDEVKDKEDEIDKLLNRLRTSLTEDYIEPNEKAIKNIHDIIGMSEEASDAIDDLDSYLDEILEGSGSFTQGFIDTFNEDMDELRQLLLDGQMAEDITAELSKNITSLNNSLDLLDEFEGMLDIPESISCTSGQLEEMLNKGLSDYNAGLEHAYEFIEEVVGGIDPRKKTENEARNMFKKSNGGRDMEDEGIEISELPSRKKIETELPEDFYNGNISELGSEIDFSDKNAAFSGNGFSFVKSVGSFLEQNLTSLRDEIYINEYIMGVFKNSVPVPRDLRHVEMSERTSFFDSEVEYIINGSLSEKTNKLMTEGQLLLLRFGLNTLHVYTDAAKKQTARAIAAAAAGWWTGGAGIPIISNLIMCGWGMGESVIDLNDLLKGNSVPFYKTKDNWNLDIGLLGDSNAAEGKSLSMPEFTYHDYLRLLLLLRSSDTKLDRMEDLMQVNLGLDESNAFRLSKCNTAIRVEVSLSMKYYFATGMFFKEDKKTQDGRHLFNMVVYEGY
jgi:hypothetical protein